MLTTCKSVLVVEATSWRKYSNQNRTIWEKRIRERTKILAMTTEPAIGKLNRMTLLTATIICNDGVGKKKRSEISLVASQLSSYLILRSGSQQSLYRTEGGSKDSFCDLVRITYPTNKSRLQLTFARKQLPSFIRARATHTLNNNYRALASLSIIMYNTYALGSMYMFKCPS